MPMQHDRCYIAAHFRVSAGVSSIHLSHNIQRAFSIFCNTSQTKAGINVSYKEWQTCRNHYLNCQKLTILREAPADLLIFSLIVLVLMLAEVFDEIAPTAPMRHALMPLVML